MPQHGWKSNHNSWNHLPDLRIENFSFGSEHLGRRELYNSANYTESRARQLFQPQQQQQPHPQQHQQVQQQQQHQQQRQPQNNGGSTRIACRLCDQIFTSIQDLINHVESHTESTIKREPINPPGVGHSLFPKKGERFSNGLLGSPSVSAPQQPPPPPPPRTAGLSFTKPQQHLQGSGGAAGAGTYPVWPYFSKVPDNAAAKKKDAASECGDMTMPLLSQLDRPLPAISRGDGFEWLDLTLKLGMK